MKTNEPVQIKYRKDYSPSNYLIDDVELKFELFDGYTLVHSVLRFRTNLDNPGGDLVLDGEQLELLSIAVDGQALTEAEYQVTDELLIIKQPKPEFTLTTCVKIYPEKNTALEGLYQSSGKYCTQCEAEGFRKITYYLDRPDVMSTFKVRIEGDKQQFPYLLSNGNKLDSGDLGDGRHFALWQDPFKKPAYLFALCAGDYDLLEDEFVTMSGRKVLLQIFVDKGKLDQCPHAMTSLKKSMAWDEEVFGLEYDLDIYMIVAVGDFNMGAMENKGLNIFNTKYVLAAQETATDQDFEDVEAVIAHEYFHNWTGNRVTCQDWFQLSLKEGLTVFRDQQFTADQTDPAVKRIDDVKVIRSHQFAEDAGPMAHPIRPDSYIEMNNFYTVTVYNKGAEIIRMYHTLLGAEGFRKGMDLYFERHDGQAVTCEDFVSAMEDANDYDLKLFRHWYSQAGTPEVRIISDYDEGQKKLTLNVEQTCPATPGQEHKSPFHIPLRIGLLDEQGNDIKLNIEQENVLQDDILNIKKEKQAIVFNGVNSKPVLSLLRNFSAPIKLHYDYNDQELSFLFAHDNDPFNRWEAGQRLFTRVIWQLCEQQANEHPMQVPEHVFDAVKDLLADEQLDGQFKALALGLPDSKALIEEVKQVNLDHLLSARKFLKQELAQHLEMDWLLHYQAHHHIPQSISDFSQDKQAVAKRAFASLCLSYLMALDKTEVYELALNQLEQANNMTDAIAAFQLLMHSNYQQKHEVAEEFYQKWQNEDLVINKWLTVLATDPNEQTIKTVTRLLDHPAFEITNPNKVRSLIGAFAGANMSQFHRPDGQGYRYLAQQIKALYAVNPQTAARLTGAFNRWKKFDGGRQQLMCEQLQGILQLPDLSRDVYEIASKALA
ncbi:MAG: aminopeptidase N [Kangiellaceae bacterium]|nr:aminopeptidase N [Kangiellaceae bacterium]